MYFYALHSIISAFAQPDSRVSQTVQVPRLSAFAQPDSRASQTVQEPRV